MWEMELSFDVNLSLRAEPYLKAMRIDTFEAELLSDIVAMAGQYLDYRNYVIRETLGPRIFLNYGGIGIRMTLYHNSFQEKDPELRAAVKELERLLLQAGSTAHA
jgi:hypothetical protein